MERLKARDAGRVFRTRRMTRGHAEASPDRFPARVAANSHQLSTDRHAKGSATQCSLVDVGDTGKPPHPHAQIPARALLSVEPKSKLQIRPRGNEEAEGRAASPQPARVFGPSSTSSRTAEVAAQGWRDRCRCLVSSFALTRKGLTLLVSVFCMACNQWSAASPDSHMRVRGHSVPAGSCGREGNAGHPHSYKPQGLANTKHTSRVFAGRLRHAKGKGSLAFVCEVV